MNNASTWPYPKWIAHRGAGQRAPENTLAAFKLGASLGYLMFECDVQVSSDGVPFLLHDDTLDRTTSGSGLACERTWSELRALDAGSWHSQPYAAEPIPSLDEVGRFCRERGLLLNLEIKPSAGQEERCGRLIAQAVVRDWSEQGRLGAWPLLSSFQPEALRAAQLAAPELPRALLLESLKPGSLDVALSLGCVAVILEASQWQPEYVVAVDALGMACATYTVNDARRGRELTAFGVTGFITDVLDPD
jgi:glycerophosphoryl diester phosphodiesterase